MIIASKTFVNKIQMSFPNNAQTHFEICKMRKSDVCSTKNTFLLLWSNCHILHMLSSSRKNWLKRIDFAKMILKNHRHRIIGQIPPCLLYRLYVLLIDDTNRRIQVYEISRLPRGANQILPARSKFNDNLPVLLMRANVYLLCTYLLHTHEYMGLLWWERFVIHQTLYALSARVSTKNFRFIVQIQIHWVCE